MAVIDNLADKSRYSELAPKQKAIVDAYLDDPNATDMQIAEKSGADIRYVPIVLEKYENIVSEKLRQTDRPDAEKAIEQIENETITVLLRLTVDDAASIIEENEVTPNVHKQVSDKILALALARENNNSEREKVIA